MRKFFLAFEIIGYSWLSTMAVLELFKELSVESSHVNPSAEDTTKDPDILEDQDDGREDVSPVQDPNADTALDDE